MSPLPTFREIISIPSSYKYSKSFNNLLNNKNTITPKVNLKTKLNLLQNYKKQAKFNYKQNLSKELLKVINSIAYIADQMKAEITDKKVN